MRTCPPPRRSPVSICSPHFSDIASAVSPTGERPQRGQRTGPKVFLLHLSITYWVTSQESNDRRGGRAWLADSFADARHNCNSTESTENTSAPCPSDCDGKVNRSIEEAGAAGVGGARDGDTAAADGDDAPDESSSFDMLRKGALLT